MYTTVLLFSLVFIAILLVGVMFVLFRQLSTLEQYQAALDDAAEQILAMSRALHQQSQMAPPPPSNTPGFVSPEALSVEHRRISMESPSGVMPQALESPSGVMPQAMGMGMQGSQVELVSYPMGHDPGAVSGFQFPQLTPAMTGHIPMAPVPSIHRPAQAPQGAPGQKPPPIPCEQCGAPLQDDLLYCVKCGKTHSSLIFSATGSNPQVQPAPHLAIDPELFPDARTVKTVRPSEEELQGSSAAAAEKTDADAQALQLGSDLPSPLDPSPRDRTLRQAPGAKAASQNASQQALPSELYTREHGRPDELLKDASALLDLAQAPEELRAHTPASTPTTPPPAGRAATGSGDQVPRSPASANTSQGPANESLTALAQVFPPDIDVLLRSTSSYPTAVQVFRPGQTGQFPGTGSDPTDPDAAAHAMQSEDFDQALKHAQSYLDLEENTDDALQFLLAMAINHIEATDSAILSVQRIDENAIADVPSEEAHQDRTPLYELHVAVAIGDQFDALLQQNIPIDQGMLGYCIEERAGLLIDDASLEASFQQGVLHDAGLSLGSFLCAPLLHEDDLYGMLLLRNPPEDEPFSLGELHILTYISHLVAEVLHKSSATILPPKGAPRQPPAGDDSGDTDIAPAPSGLSASQQALKATNAATPQDAPANGTQPASTSEEPKADPPPSSPHDLPPPPMVPSNATSTASAEPASAETTAETDRSGSV